MSKLMLEPYYGKSRNPPVWKQKHSLETIKSMTWGPGYGMAVGNYGTVRICSDGLTWTTIPTIATLGSMLNHVLWTGWCWIVTGSETDGTTVSQFAMYSADSVLWKRIVMPDASNTFLAASAFDGTTYIFAGRTKCYATTDFVHFTVITSPAANTCRGMVWLGAYFAIWGGSIGGFSTNLSTLTFNGTAWVFKTIAQQPIFNVGDASSNLVANGYGGAVFFTTFGVNWWATNDGGSTWTSAITGITQHGGDGTGPSTALASCWSVNQYVVIFGWKKFTSYDGVTWTRDLNTTHQEAYSILCSDGANLYGYVKPWYITRSSDNGNKWELSKSTPASDLTYGSCSQLHSITATSLGLFAYSSANYYMYFSGNGGETWFNTGFTCGIDPDTYYTGSGGGVVPNNYKLWDCGSFTALFTSNNKIFTTLDGLNWFYDQAAVPSPTLVGSSFSAGGAYAGAGFGNTCIVVGNSGTIDCSQDGGYTWTKNVAKGLTTSGLRYASWNGSQFLATTASTILYSADGLTWKKVTFPNGVQGAGGAHIWTGSNYIMATGNTQVITSPDGQTWTAHATPTTMFVDFASNGTRVIATTPANLNATTLANIDVFYSDDFGTTWIPSKVPVNAICYLVTCTSNGRFYLTFQNVSASFRVWSDDGINWKTDAMIQPVLTTGLRYGIDGTTIYSGNGNCMLKSLDGGLTWEPRYYGFQIDSVVIDKFGGWMLKSVSNLYTSPDGMSLTLKTIGSFYSTPPRNSLDYNPDTGVTIAPEAYKRQVLNTLASVRTTDSVNWVTMGSAPTVPGTTGVLGGNSNTKYLGNNTWFMDYEYVYGYCAPLLSFDDGANWTSGPNMGSGGDVFDFVFGDVNGVVVSTGGVYTYNSGGTYTLTKSTLTYTGIGFGDQCFVVTGLVVGAYSYDDGLTWFTMPYGSSAAPAGPYRWNGTDIIAFKVNGTISTLTPPPKAAF